MDRSKGVGVALAVEGVSKIYKTDEGPTEALSRVDLDIAPGEFIALLGPSGCGKSTLLLLASGILTPTTGTIRLAGAEVDGPSQNVGFAFQQDWLLEWRTVLQNILLQCEMRGLRPKDYRDRALDLLNTVDLAEFAHRYPSELSGGMRQRVALLRALIMDQPLLLLDEPFGALDAFTRDQMCLDFQHMWWSTWPTVLFVTHSITEAVLLADKVVVMTPRPGRIDSIKQIDLPRPRRLTIRESSEFVEHVTELRDKFMDFGVLREPGYAKWPQPADPSS